MTRTIKMLGLMAGVAVINIVMLSPGLLNVEIGGDSALETAVGFTVLVTSLLVLFYGCYRLLLNPPSAPPVREMVSPEHFAAALQSYRHVKVLKQDVSLALDQLSRMGKKKLALQGVLRQRFSPEELSYRKFASVVEEVEKLFYMHVRGMLTKLGVFDVSDFAALAHPERPSPFSGKLMQEKMALYKEYLSYVSGYLSANEEILLKLDKLLLEISRLGSTDYRDIEEMPCMKEIDTLIHQTKYYNH